MNASEAGDRLARTRLAILEHIAHSRRGKPPGAPGPDAGESASQGRWGGIRTALHDGWEHHPARIALRIAFQWAEPGLRAYVQRHPMQLLAGCAAAGAMLVLARPWRLVSVTGVLLAAIRSPRLASMVLSALMTGSEGKNVPPHPARSSP